MPFVNPYRDRVEGRDPIEVFSENARTIPALVERWTPAQFAASYAPGKWSGARLLVHLLQIEIVDGFRLRMALSDPAYVVQPFEPEAWMAAEPLADGPAALAAWRGLRAVDLELWRSVPAGRWDLPFQHPETGDMTLRDLAGIWSGHELHHLDHLREIDRKTRG
jgi:hypothetical protein